jgi:hypothetical protein
VLVNLTYVALLWETFERAEETEISAQARRMMRVRSFFDVGSLHYRDGAVGQISPLRLGTGLLLFGLLSPAGSSPGRRSGYQNFCNFKGSLASEGMVSRRGQ